MRRTLTATRYVTPLREGGSLPAIVEGDDDGLYVVKFRGAGQGPRVLVAELIAGELARALELPVPEIVAVEIDPALGRNEPDYEIRELLKSSAGLNLAMDYLPGSVSFDPLAGPFPSAELASSIVWFDALVLNVDRTPRNPNLLCWHRKLWLIDHGASLYFHHAWDSAEAATRSRFPMIKDHVLLPWATKLEEVAPKLRARIDRAVLEKIVSTIPDTWLEGSQRFPDAATHRAAYLDWLERRVASADAFLEEAVRARAQLV